MVLFVLIGVLSPRRRLYEPEAAGFRLRRTDVRLPAPLCGDRAPYYGLDQNKNYSFLNWALIVFILDSWMNTSAYLKINLSAHVNVVKRFKMLIRHKSLADRFFTASRLTTNFFLRSGIVRPQTKRFKNEKIIEAF
jgi:hypothetical protein